MFGVSFQSGTRRGRWKVFVIKVLHICYKERGMEGICHEGGPHQLQGKGIDGVRKISCYKERGLEGICCK